MAAIPPHPWLQEGGTKVVLSLPWVDQVGIAIVLSFVVLGVWRGLWWQVVRLLGVLAAVALARSLTPRIAPVAADRFPELAPLLVGGSIWFFLFLCGLVVASLLGMIGKRALDTMQLGLVDRVGGGMAGALTGAILHSVLLVVLCTLPAREWSVGTVQGTRSAMLLEAMTTKGRILVDAQAAERFRTELGLDPEPEADAAPEHDVDSSSEAQ